MLISNKKAGLPKKAILPKILASLMAVGAIIFVTSFINHAHANTPKSSEAQSSKDEQMEDQHIRAKARARLLREKTKARVEKHKAEMAERQAVRKAKMDEDRKRHLYFKDALLSMLVTDAIIDSEAYPEHYHVSIIYKDAEIIANDVNLSARFGERYHALWKIYNRDTSDASYISIDPQNYEVRETNAAGGNYHFKMQTG